jgi:general secretion pathway protein G
LRVFPSGFAVGRRRCRFKTHGFTLVEIMIVVAIIAVLATIAIASMVRVRRMTRETVALNDLRIISDAIETLATETSRWPGGIPCDQEANPEIWNLTLPYAGLMATDGAFPKWNGPYLRRIPLDPWGMPYFFDPDYRIGGRYYPVVGSFGPDKWGRNRYNEDDIYVILR